MAEPRPTDSVRDTYLDMLARAHAEGRVEPGQFSARVEQIMNCETKAELDLALAHLRQNPAPGYRPQPVYFPPPPPVVEVPRLTPVSAGGWDRKSIVVTALAGVLAIGGLGIMLANVGDSDRTPDSRSVAIYADESLMPFTYRAVQLPDWVDNAIFTMITITDSEIVLERKPYGKPWETRTVTDGGEATTSAPEGVNVFDGGDFDVHLVVDLIHISQDEYLPGQVESLQIFRPSSDATVVVAVQGDEGTVVTWDAASGELISVA